MAKFNTEIYDVFQNAHQDKAQYVGPILTTHSQPECEKWIAKRKETWRFHQELLMALRNSSRKEDHSSTKKFLPTKNKEIQALFKELKGFVESKRIQDEGRGLFVPRQMFRCCVENFREVPKSVESQKPTLCPDLLHTQDFDTPENKHLAPVDDTKNTQSKVKPSKRPSLKKRILKFFRWK